MTDYAVAMLRGQMIDNYNALEVVFLAHKNGIADAQTLEDQFSFIWDSTVDESFGNFESLLLAFDPKRALYPALWNVLASKKKPAGAAPSPPIAK